MIEVTDEMIELFDEAWSGAIRFRSGDRRRAGLKAVLDTIPFSGPITFVTNVPESQTAYELEVAKAMIRSEQAERVRLADQVAQLSAAHRRAVEELAEERMQYEGLKVLYEQYRQRAEAAEEQAARLTQFFNGDPVEEPATWSHADYLAHEVWAAIYVAAVSDENVVLSVN